MIALFHFRGLLLVWGMTISKSLGSLLVTREGEVCMKNDDHQMRHPRGHLGDRTSAKGTRGCAWRDDQFGRGQNTVLGWKAGEEGRNYVLQLRLHHLLLLVNLISLGKTRK